MTPGDPRGRRGLPGTLQPMGYPFPFQQMPATPVVSTEQRAELREAWGSIVKRKWFILALVAMASLVAFLVRQSLPPAYRADVTMVLDSSSVRLPGLREGISNRSTGDYLDTQIEVIRSRAVAERTARALKLWQDPAVDPRVTKPTWYERTLQSFGVRWNPKVAGGQFSEDALVNAATTAIVQGLSVTPVRNTYILKVGFTHDDKEVAVAVANELATQYVATVQSDRSLISSESNRQLLDKLVPLREQLTKSEQALIEFTASRGIVNMGGTSASPIGQQLGGMTDRLVIAQSERLSLEAAAREVRSAPKGSWLNVPAVMRDPSMSETLRQLSAAKAVRTSLLETFTPESFRVRQVDEEITRLQASASAQAQIVGQNILSRYDSAVSNEAAIARSVGQIRGNLQNTNRDEFELASLQRAVERDRKIFEAFMTQVKELGIASDMQPTVARVLDTARGSYPVARGNPNLVQMTAVMTLFLACMGAAFIDRLDNSVKGVGDAEARLGQHVLTALPMRDKAARSKMARIFIDEPESSYSEGIRTARTGVMLSTLDIDRKVILVTSSVPGEGKTTVAINLALSHAQTQSTLLIDCDLRRSRVGHSMGIKQRAKGLTDFVSGHATATECIVPYEGTGLSVLPAGTPPPNPLELLVTQRFKETIAKLSQQFEVIVIDSPPIELVSDALMLAQLSTNCVYVVRAMKTPVPLVRKGVARLQHAGGDVMGVVLNWLDFKASRNYHGEYGAGDTAYGSYSGGYGYGGNYGKEGKPKKSRKEKDTTLAQEAVAKASGLQMDKA
jgi:polysaccharide biosynthesis transport protein